MNNSVNTKNNSNYDIDNNNSKSKQLNSKLH